MCRRGEIGCAGIGVMVNRFAAAAFTGVVISQAGQQIPTLARPPIDLGISAGKIALVSQFG